MLAGRLPFHATTPQGYIVKHASSEPKTLSKNFQPGTCPPELDRIVMKMLAKDREERYQDMQGVVNDLNQFEKNPIQIPIPEAQLSETIDYKIETTKPGKTKVRTAITGSLPSQSRFKTILLVAGFLLAAVYGAALYVDHLNDLIPVSTHRLPVRYKMRLPLV